ncbi:MAG: DNA repair protein RadA [Bacteroidales bacterium]
MAKKAKTIYLCTNCGAESPKWVGKCPYCGEWNTYKEQKISKGTAESKYSEDSPQKIQKLTEISIEKEKRLSTQYSEVDRVLGGGIVYGSLILVGGEPGIGKSTLALQIALQSKDTRTLYVSGEESPRQIKLRAGRLGEEHENIYLLNETELDNVLNQCSEFKPDVLIIDSIQTLFSQNIDSTAGSVTQVRECAAQLLKYAKRSNTPVLLIGHINKDGNIAGPKVLEHIVDVVLQFEGDSNYDYRVLRSLKNRFGSTSEIGIFEMHNDGLNEVHNPSKLLINLRQNGLSGVSIAATLDGMRPFMVEIQSLVSPSVYGNPQRSATGFDIRRLSMLLAVLEKRSGLNIYNKDVFLNIAGGIKVVDPAVDLSILTSLLSSVLDKPVPENVCFAGEVGLSGEIRAVNQVENRLSEAEKIGFKNIYISGHHKINPDNYNNIKIYKVYNVGDLLRHLFKR